MDRDILVGRGSGTDLRDEMYEPTFGKYWCSAPPLYHVGNFRTHRSQPNRTELPWPLYDMVVFQVYVGFAPWPLRGIRFASFGISQQHVPGGWWFHLLFPPLPAVSEKRRSGLWGLCEPL